MIKSVAVAALCVLMTGCLFVVDSKQRSGSQQWSNHEVDRIEVGRTSADWISRTFGPADRVSRYEDGTEVWRYRNRSTTESRVGLFLLFRVNVERDHTETLALEVRDGVVTDYWVERRN